MFNHFVDDNVGGADTLENLVEILHMHYFPRLLWAYLALNPSEYKFFVPSVQLLGPLRDLRGIRPSEDKPRVFKKCPSSRNKEELGMFLYKLLFL